MCMPVNTFSTNAIPPLDGRNARYKLVTVRIAGQLKDQCVNLAREFGWQRSDLLRTLTCIGASFSFLAMDDPDRINAATELLSGLRVLSHLSGYGLSHRPYAARIRERRSTLLTMSLPRSFCVLVGIYAEMHTISCNEVYCEFLKRGLLIYLKAHATLFESSK